MYPEPHTCSIPDDLDIAEGTDGSGTPSDDPSQGTIRSSPKMISLWKCAIELTKALLLHEINLDTDYFLKNVEEFEGISQATEPFLHYFCQVKISATSSSMAEFEDGSQSENYDGDEFYPEDDFIEDDDEFYDRDSSNIVPLGSLPIDDIAERLRRK